MDRHRIRAIMKLVESGPLNKSQLALALKELAMKCSIYGNGCLKRGKREEGEFYLQLPERLEKGSFSESSILWSLDERNGA